MARAIAQAPVFQGQDGDSALFTTTVVFYGDDVPNDVATAQASFAIGPHDGGSSQDTSVPQEFRVRFGAAIVAAAAALGLVVDPDDNAAPMYGIAVSS